MSEQQQERAARTSVAVTWPVRDRLAALERQIAAKENRTMTPNLAIEWLMDVADAADLP